MLVDLLRDFRYSARSLARTPGFTAQRMTAPRLEFGC
jgi:hypothetical protein